MSHVGLLQEAIPPLPDTNKQMSSEAFVERVRLQHAEAVARVVLCPQHRPPAPATKAWERRPWLLS